MRPSRLIIPLLALLTLSCGPTVDVTKTSGTALTPTTPANVQILYAPPTRAYDEIGLLSTRNNPSYGMDKAENAMREKAATLGADAVILNKQREFHVNLLQSGFDLDGIAIKYK